MMTNTQSSTSNFADGQYCLPANGSNTGSSADEWLNLSLGGGQLDDTNNYGGQHHGYGNGHVHHAPSSVSPNKFFKCKYCTRKFLNSRALGGHQNAHKKERGEIRRFHMERSLTMGMPYHHQNKPTNAVVQSIGVEPHALLHGDQTVHEVEEPAGVHGYDEHMTKPNWTPPQRGYVEERMSSWPGSFRCDSSSSYDTYKMHGDQSLSTAFEGVPNLNRQPWQDSQPDYDLLADVSLDLSL